jgi:hypothetical protein
MDEDEISRQIVTAAIEASHAGGQAFWKRI